MKIKIKKKIEIVFIIISLYYIPYLLLEWAGVAHAKAGSAPIWYKTFRLIFPLFFICMLNLKLRIKKEIIVIISFIFIFINIISNIFYKNVNMSYEIGIFFLFYIFCPKVNLKNLKTSTLLAALNFSLISVIFEKYFLFKFLAIKPVFVMSWQERYIGNMGGPNTLGAFINLIWVILIFKYKKDKKILKLFITMISLYIIKLTDSDSAIIIFIFNFWYVLLKKIQKGKVLYHLISFILGLGIMYLKLEKFINDGSNITRLKIISLRFKNITLINLKFIFNESPFFIVLFSYGIIIFFLYLLFWILVYKTEIFKYKNKKSLYLMKNLIFYQILIYSLVLPVMFLFPMNILYILSLKLKEGEKYEE